ncbi:hypothetical protein MINS_38040 [Mycolicibacterium insubricum]|jgi:hypothetical protein|nr:hypothetical protein [Mycolicibacterium insubricum]MCB0928774.1 hypothetical protein [Mycobacterium sp.]MCB9442095.1 hypothetical protein [Mycolicibacterium sp.]BBZ68375.1 hypothetical protein MINS_38040 [Mycolicibacterium insubricum]
MSRTRNLLATTAAVVLGAASTLANTGVASADPAPAAPIGSEQAPGLPAIEGLSPIIQQAAADPSGAASLLMAAARAFTSKNGASDDTKNVANAVNTFVEPQAHLSGPDVMPPGVPASQPHEIPAGVVAGAESHLPPGINPANAAGPTDPAPQAAAETPSPTPAPAPAPAPNAVQPVAATTPAPDGAPAPAAAPAAPAAADDAPVTQDFMYPSIGNGCLADGGNSLATALTVAGPAKIPTPGPGPGQAAYVFTAVGTSAPAEVQKLPLNVTWVNLTTGKSGTATLKPQADINPQGPTTLTAIVDTGSGSIMSTIFGQVTTTEKQCQFMPTIGSAVIP